MRIRKILSSRSGDTLVEVMASIVLFLLMMGILQGAVAYSGSALKKNREIRQENSKILEKVRAAEAEGDKTKKGSVTETFQAIDSSLTTRGNEVFSVTADLYTITVPAASEEKNVTFSFYGTTKSASSGTDGDGSGSATSGGDSSGQGSTGTGGDGT